MVNTDTDSSLLRVSRPNCMPAPAAMSPSASDAALMRPTVGSSHGGMRKPSRLAASPVAVAMISGLRSSSRTKPCWPPRAMGHTAATFSSGTHTPISTATMSRPCAPARRSARASTMKELKRKATCAAAAWSRRSMCLPSQGRCGRL